MDNSSGRFRSASWAMACLLAACGAQAQESRTEAVIQEKNAKAAAAAPHDAGWLEKGLNLIQEEASAPPIGFYPVFTSIYTQSWVSLGVGYRRPFGDTGAVVLDGAYSLRGFWRTRGRVTLPTFADNRATVELRGFLLDAKKVRFYGIGDDSSREDLSHYAFLGTDALAEVRFVAAPGFTVGAHAAFSGVNTREGGSGAPSIEEVFTPDEVPGLGTDPGFVRGRLFAEYDWRPAKGYTRRGGRVGAAVTTFRETGDLPYDFTRLDLEAVQHVPVYRENWVLAFRGLMSTTSTPAGNVVPYFLLPALGESSDELRGYPALRFRDGSRYLLTAEYRWMPSHYLDLALFVDGGNVAPEASRLTLNEIKTSWGVSARLHTQKDTVMHLSVARGGEGWRFIFGVGPVF
jgi:hypothetical protein